MVQRLTMKSFILTTKQDNWKEKRDKGPLNNMVHSTQGLQTAKLHILLLFHNEKEEIYILLNYKTISQSMDFGNHLLLLFAVNCMPLLVYQ